MCLKEYQLTGKLPPETPALGDTPLPAVRKRPGAGVQRRQSNLNVVKQMRNSVVFSPTNSPFDAYTKAPFPQQQQPISEMDESFVSEGSFRERMRAPPPLHPTNSGPSLYVNASQSQAQYPRNPGYAPAHLPAHLTVSANNELSRSLEDLNRNSAAPYYPNAPVSRQPPRAMPQQVVQPPGVRLLPRTDSGVSHNAATLTRREAQPNDRPLGVPRYTLKQAANINAPSAAQQGYTVRSAVGNPDWLVAKAESVSLGNDELDAASIGSTQSGSLQEGTASNGSYAYTYDLLSRVAPHFVRVESANVATQSMSNQLNAAGLNSDVVSLSGFQRTPSAIVPGPHDSPNVYMSSGPDRNDSSDYVYKVVPAPESSGQADISLQAPQQLASSADSSQLSQSSQTPYSVTVLRTRGAHRPSPLGLAQKRLSTSDTQLNQAGMSFVAEQAPAVVNKWPPHDQPYPAPNSFVPQAQINYPQATQATQAHLSQSDKSADLISLNHGTGTQLNPTASDTMPQLQPQLTVEYQLYPGNYRQSTQFVTLAAKSPGPTSKAPDLSDIFSANSRDRARGLGYVPEKTGQFWYSGSSSLDSKAELAPSSDSAFPQQQHQQANDASRAGPNVQKVLPRFV